MMFMFMFMFQETEGADMVDTDVKILTLTDSGLSDI